MGIPPLVVGKQEMSIPADTKPGDYELEIGPYLAGGARRIWRCEGRSTFSPATVWS